MGDTNKRHGLVIDTSMIDLGRVIASQDHNLPEVRVQDPEMSPPPTEQDQNLPSEMEFPLSDAGGGAEAGPVLTCASLDYEYPLTKCLEFLPSSRSIYRRLSIKRRCHRSARQGQEEGPSS